MSPQNILSQSIIYQLQSMKQFRDTKLHVTLGGLILQFIVTGNVPSPSISMISSDYLIPHA